MEELSGKVQKASTHVNIVGVDFAIVERDCATANVDATTSILPNNKARQQKQAPQWGDGGSVRQSSEGEHLLEAEG